MNEIEYIKTELFPAIREKYGEEKLGKVSIGEYIKQPDFAGCFKYNSDWFVYTVDERVINCFIRGPFKIEACIYTLALKLGIAKSFSRYKFNEEEQDIFFDNKFTSLDEVDDYYREKIGDNYQPPRKHVPEYRYYKFAIGDGVIRRNDTRIELLDTNGEWIEKRELISKLVGGLLAYEEIPEALGLFLADVRRAQAQIKEEKRAQNDDPKR